MTTRRWMLVVAVFSVGLAGLLHMERLSKKYLSRAMDCSFMAAEMMAKKALLEANLARGPKITPEERANYERELRKASEKIEYYNLMPAKYQRAIACPWLGVD
jgi:hypothetical protein